MERNAGLRALVHSVYAANKEKNYQSGIENRARKELLAQMTEGEIELFETSHQGITLVATVEEPVSYVCDVAKLKGMVDAETFLAIVSATKEAVTRLAGTAVYESCAKETKGEARAVVKAKK